MAQRPFLKSIQPRNLLSFGPATDPIELRPLNVLIGPNGGGKSNFIEILGLASDLPSKDPWSTVIETGGADEWVWKGASPTAALPTLAIRAQGQMFPREASIDPVNLDPSNFTEKPDFYSIELKGNGQGSFEVASELFRQEDRSNEDRIRPPWFNRSAWLCAIHETDQISREEIVSHFSLNPTSAAISASGIVSEFAVKVPRIRQFAENLADTAFYRDWSFGVDASPRDPQPAGLDSRRLDEDMRNLAQVLKAWRDRGDQPSFHRLTDLLKAFYEPARDVDVELLGTHLRIMIKEEGLSSRTPGTRLSDGTLRWLALLTVLLNPVPPPVTCIEEPELGLHPDGIHTLADLLRDASARTQLVVTTHSSALVDAFSDTPEAICVCEKVDGATEIKRLERDNLKVWLGKYSLGHLWASGQIGGNRW